MFSLIWGFADVYMWKGIWEGVDCVLADGKKDWFVAIGTLTFGTACLIAAGKRRGLKSHIFGNIYKNYLDFVLYVNIIITLNYFVT